MYRDRHWAPDRFVARQIRPSSSSNPNAGLPLPPFSDKIMGVAVITVIQATLA